MAKIPTSKELREKDTQNKLKQGGTKNKRYFNIASF